MLFHSGTVQSIGQLRFQRSKDPSSAKKCLTDVFVYWFIFGSVNFFNIQMFKKKKIYSDQYISESLNGVKISAVDQEMCTQLDFTANPGEIF